MKVINLLKLGGDFMKLMSENDIKMSDHKHIDMYTEYVRMRDEGVKYVAVVMILSQKYAVSESTLKRIVKRFEKDL